MFVGIFGKESDSALRSDTARIYQVLDPYRVADVSGDYQTDRARIFQTLTHNTPESLNEEVPCVCRSSGLVIASWLRLDNRTELAASLDIDGVALKGYTDPELVLTAYRKWADDCVTHLIGDFSFIIYNPSTDTVFAARDAVGVKPLYYYHAGGQLVICSGARVLHALNGLHMTPDQEWMALYAIGISTSFTDTPWPKVKKLAPGHSLQFSYPKVRLQRYFELIDDAPQVFSRCEKYLTDYKATLDQANICRLRSHFPIGSETSGGLDSSTVTGYAAYYRDKSKNDLHTFGNAFCEQEPEFILDTSIMHGVVHNHIITGVVSAKEFQESRARTLVLLGYPEEHLIASSHEPFYRLCETLGVRTLLSGFGGDEVVTNSGYLLMYELIDNHKYGLLYKTLPGAAWLKPLRFVRALHRSFTRKSGDSHLSRAFASRWPLMAISPEISDQYSLYQRFIAAASYDSAYRSINQFILGDRWAPFVPTRLDNCTLMAAARKIDYRWPLLDQRLLQQYLSTPSIEKYGNGYGRYLHRRAMAGVAPDNISWKNSKSMGGVMRPQNQEAIINKSTLQAIRRELTESFHPALEPIIDHEKFAGLDKIIMQLDRVKNTSQWNNISGQITRFKALNDWLTLYHR